MDNAIPGVRLAPKDSEVVHLFLQRRVQHLHINNCFIFDRENFYATHPQLIPLPPPHIFLDQQESWFFVERTMQGQRVNRLVADNSGRWVGQKKYSIVEGGITIAYKQKLVFKNNQNLNTGWHQIEFSLNSAPVQSLAVVKLVYQEEDDVLHQQLMAQLQQQQLEAQHQMQQLMAQHPLQHLMAQHQLQQLETQHQIQQLMAQHPLQPLMAQHQLQQLEAQHQLQLLEAQHQLQHLMAQHPLQHLMAQHQLQLLEAQHQLQLLEAQQHLQHLQQLEAQHQLQQPEAQQQPQHVEAMVMSDVQVPHNEEELDNMVQQFEDVING